MSRRTPRASLPSSAMGDRPRRDRACFVSGRGRRRASPVREALGIARHGPGVLQHWMNVIFETDLPTMVQGRALRSVLITDINGTFVPRGNGRWLMAVQVLPERGQRPEDFTVDHCRDLIRRGAGQSGLNPTIVDARSWEAARGRGGPVTLPGACSRRRQRARHAADWRLRRQRRHSRRLQPDVEARAPSYAAARAPPARLLRQERRPVADATVAQALARLQAWFKDSSRKLPPPVPIADDNAVVFGYRYASGAFVGGDAKADPFENPRAPSARPGSRAPHLVVEHHGRRLSTIDLFNGHWVLFTGPNGEEWSRRANRPHGNAPAIQRHTIAPAGDLRDFDQRWLAAYGLGRPEPS